LTFLCQLYTKLCNKKMKRPLAVNCVWWK
jgi:hypothetical protein